MGAGAVLLFLGSREGSSSSSRGSWTTLICSGETEVKVTLSLKGSKADAQEYFKLLCLDALIPPYFCLRS